MSHLLDKRGTRWILGMGHPKKTVKDHVASTSSGVMNYRKKGGWVGRYVVMNKTWVFVGIILQHTIK